MPQAAFTRLSERQSPVSGFSAVCVLARIALVTLLCAAVTDGAAQTLQPRGPLKERLYNRVPVSGAVVVGLRAQPTEGHVDPHNLWALIPEHLESLLCVSLVSPDGRYEGSAEYEIAGMSPGRYRLQFPTRYAAQLRGFVADEFGTFAVASSSCSSADLARSALSSSGVSAIVIAWTPIESPDSVVIQVQSGQTSAVVQLNDPSSRQIPCRYPLSRSAVSFDAICVVPITRGAAVRLRLERWHLQDRLDSRAMVIKLP
jgi:hypothetical protein